MLEEEDVANGHLLDHLRYPGKLKNAEQNHSTTHSLAKKALNIIEPAM